VINKTAFFLVFFLLVAFNTSLANFVFEKDLRLGESSSDILELQKFLNKSTDTRVSDSGPGSLGSETNYFGSKTLQSVIKFQEKYRNEILVPNGLTSGTGFVGPSTRKKINEILLSEGSSVKVVEEAPIARAEIENVNQPSLFSLQTPKIFSVSSFQVNPGGKLILYGTGFSLSANDVYMGDNKVLSGLKSSDGAKLEITVPNDFAEGNYNLWISNASGNTKNQIQGDFVTVSKNPKPVSTISKIEPTETHADNISTVSVKITGENFSESQNDIYSSLGNINNIRSENGVITFSLSSLPEISRVKSIPSSVGKIKIPIYFFVKNDSGVTQTPAVFYLNLN